MIGSLRGTLLDRQPTEVLVDVNGVGYRVLVSPSTLVTLGEPGGTVTLHTHLHVREDALTLYGFPSLDERACFEALLGAHGVGPALAMAILAVHRPDNLRRVLPDGDILTITGGTEAGPRSEVREALASLGYGPQEIAEALRDLPADGDVQRLLKDALTRLATVR